MSINNNTVPQAEEIQAKLDIISKANETSVLMALLCEKLGLNPRTTTHQDFVNSFTELQKERLEAEKFMQEQFVLSQDVKTRKKREQKAVMDTIEGMEDRLNLK